MANSHMFDVIMQDYKCRICGSPLVPQYNYRRRNPVDGRYPLVGYFCKTVGCELYDNLDQVINYKLDHNKKIRFRWNRKCAKCGKYARKLELHEGKYTCFGGCSAIQAGTYDNITKKFIKIERRSKA